MASNAVGRTVLVPHACWPSFRCREHGGAGSEATVVAVDRLGNATINYTYAVSSDGRPYEGVELTLSTLKPI